MIRGVSERGEREDFRVLVQRMLRNEAGAERSHGVTEELGFSSRK